MPRPPNTRPNLAAGFRRLGARKHAKLLDHQSEALAAMNAADRVIVEAVKALRDVHRLNRHAEGSLRAASETASAALYQAPADDYADRGIEGACA